MESERWTIIVGFGAGFRSFQFTVSKRQLIVTLSTLLIGVSLFLGMVLKSLDNRGDLFRYTLLKRKKQDLLFKLGRLSQDIDSLRAAADGWAELDRAVRMMADLRIVEPDVRALGVGGRTTREANPPPFLKPALREELQDLKGSIGELQRDAAFKQESFNEVLRSLRTQQDLLAHTPSIMPAAGRLTSGFGWRHNRLLRRREFHKGVDIANRSGTPIFAPADGVVVYEGWKNGFGRFLTIDHGYGYKTRYGHLRRIVVRMGERVRRGQIVANMGNTGFSTGPHLHYEVLVLGTHVNPRDYMAWEFARY